MLIRILKWTPFYWIWKLWDLTIEAKVQELHWLHLGPYWREILSGERDIDENWTTEAKRMNEAP